MLGMGRGFVGWRGGVLAAALALVFAASASAAGGGAWSVRATPDQPGVTNNVLYGISCPSAQSCVAVGFSGNGQYAGRALAERWDGQSWSIFQTIQSPKADADLAAVSCTASWYCIAVGSHQHGRHQQWPLSERWNGRTWSILRTPQPRGARTTTLNGVTCISSHDCVAVGGYRGRSHGKAVVERWNGRRWSIEATVKAPFGGAGSFNAVACPSRRSCIAVGVNSVQGPDEVPLTARWNGRHWRRVTAPNAPSARATGFAGISCTSARACLAVGSAVRGISGPEEGFAEHWNGHRW